MSVPVPILLAPPRPTGNVAADQQATMDYLWTVYRSLAIALDQVASLGTIATQDASNVNISGGTLSPDVTGGTELTVHKDAVSGYVGLSATYQIQFKNAAGTFTSTFSNTNTAARDYTFPDSTGTIALTSDLTPYELLSHKNASGGYVGMTATFQVEFPNALGTFTSTLVNDNTAGREYIFPDWSGTVLLQESILGSASTAPTIASASTIAPTKEITFISGVTAIDTITPPPSIAAGGGFIILIPTGIFTTSVAGNIALASTAVVSKALVMVYDATTTKWYPSY